MRSADDEYNVAQPTSQHSITLHELRKTIRELRYKMELFEPVYKAELDKSLHFKDKVAVVTKLQGALGAVHDLVRIYASSCPPSIISVTCVMAILPLCYSEICFRHHRTSC